MTLRLLVALVSIAVLSGCAREIPNRVGADEYALYSEWTVAHFGKNPPEHLYFSSRTGAFDPLQTSCQASLEKDGVNRSLMNQLHGLGEAQYPLDFGSSANLQIPWSYKEVDTAPDLAPGTFHLITFSRVAFNRDHTEALFAFFDACAFGECGQGAYIQGTKQGGKWNFHPGSCAMFA
jgi:hypothetical protein